MRFSTRCNTLLQHTATHCNTLQHTAGYIYRYRGLNALLDTLQHTAATHCNTLQVIYIETAAWMRFLTPQYTTIHCNTLLQHTATHCNTLQVYRIYIYIPQAWCTCRHRNTLQHTTTHCCNTLTYCSLDVLLILAEAAIVVLAHSAPHCCNTLQHTACTHTYRSLDVLLILAQARIVVLAHTRTCRELVRGHGAWHYLLDMTHDSLKCVTWLNRMCDTSHSQTLARIGRDLGLTHMCDMTPSYVHSFEWHDWSICVTWLICQRLSRTRRTTLCHTPSVGHGLWIIYMCDMTHLPTIVTNSSDDTVSHTICRTWFVNHLYVWHDSFANDCHELVWGYCVTHHL